MLEVHLEVKIQQDYFLLIVRWLSWKPVAVFPGRGPPMAVGVSSSSLRQTQGSCSTRASVSQKVLLVVW